MADLRYKTTWEMVSPFAAGGAFYRGDDPACRPEDVPDDWWHTTEVEHNGDADRLDQYETLKGWAETGEQLIRNVQLWSMPVGEWAEVLTDD